MFMWIRHANSKEREDILTKLDTQSCDVQDDQVCYSN